MLFKLFFKYVFRWFFCCYDFSFDLENMLINKDFFFFFITKTYLNFQVLIFFQNSKQICFFIKYKSDFFTHQNWFVFSLNTDLNFFTHQNWSVFSLNIDLIFFKRIFFVNKIVDFWNLREEVKSWDGFLFDACNIDLFHEYSSSSKK